MRKGLAVVFACLVLSGCGYQEGVVQKAERSFLRFTGNWSNATVQIDAMPAIELKPPGAYDDPKASPNNTLYQVYPGTHRVVVTRGGTVVVDRVVVLDNQVTMEIQIP